MTPEDVLSGAINYINEHGWCRHSLQTDDGRVCLMGALHHAAGVQFVRHPEIDANHNPKGDAWGLKFFGDIDKALHAAERKIVRALDPSWVDSRSYIIQFNDEVAADADDVIHLLKRAIDVEDTR